MAESKIAWPPKPQRLYVNMNTGQIALFDSFARWPYLGVYRLSTKDTVRLRTDEMRRATPQEEERFGRAKKARIEATSWEPSRPEDPRRRCDA